LSIIIIYLFASLVHAMSLLLKLTNQQIVFILVYIIYFCMTLAVIG